MQNRLKIVFSSCETKEEVTLHGSISEINEQLEAWVMNEHDLMTVKEAKDMITDEIEILSVTQIN